MADVREYYLPMTSTIGLVNARCDDVVRHFVDWLGPVLANHDQGISCPYFDNGWRGTDAAPISVMSRLVEGFSLRLTAVPGKGQGRTATLQSTMYPATIFQLFEKGKSTRSIACANDGGTWLFEQRGTPLPFEEVARYSGSPIRTRFTALQLEDIVVKMTGRSPWDERSYQGPDTAAHGTLTEKNGQLPRALKHYSLAEARAKLGIHVA